MTTTTDPEKITKAESLSEAYEGSFYTICGAGGPAAEWVGGYEEMLETAEIGKPVGWFQTTGAVVNEFAGLTKDPFKDDLTILLFPLTGLNAGKLAMFKIRMEDRWFDDVIDNMR